MTSIERTAYPRFATQRILKTSELETFYSPTSEEQRYIKTHSRGNIMRLNFAVLLKSFQRLGYFPALETVPPTIIAHLKKFLLLPAELEPHYEHASALYRHHNLIREYLIVTPWGSSSPNSARRHAIQAAHQASKTMNNPADIINVVIEELIQHRFELPAFSALDRLVKHTRSIVNNSIFNRISKKLTLSETHLLDDLLVTPPESNRSGFNKLKNLPKRATITHFKELITHHHWLMNLGSFLNYFNDISKIKQEQFAAEAITLDASDLSEISPSKRYTLIVSLIHAAQSQAKDAVALTFCKTMRRIHKQGEEKLALLRDQYMEKTHDLLSLFSDVLVNFRDQNLSRHSIKRIKEKLENQGGTEALLISCTEVMAYNTHDYFLLLWPYFHKKRSTLIKMIKELNLGSTTQNELLIQAINIMLDNAHKKSEYLSIDVDLSFVSRQWKKLIFKKDGDKNVVARRHFEAWVFSCLANELRSGDIFIEGAESYADYRKDLQDWNLCEPQLEEYCRSTGLPSNGKDFVKQLKENLKKTAKRVDDSYLDLSELIIEPGGRPLLKKRSRKNRSSNAIWLSQEIRKRMPERHLLDSLCSTHHYTGWAHLFCPLSGSEPKIENAIERYIFNTFSQGTGMGPTQAAQHIRAEISAHMLSWINRRHVTPKLLDQALKLLINCCNTFEIIKAWGDGTSCAADGTFQTIYKENLLAEYHIRYGETGGIAYHHVANNYVALFSTFIPCGLWEAIAIIEALLKNESNIQPKTIHADTQGQSTPVFGLSYLLGIKLMPRIRNWKDLTFYRPDAKTKYAHIDSLFGDEIDWKLIETHWRDLMQVVLSIKAGKISSSLLLRKLGHYSRKNRLYKAFQELGRVIRTQFLLEYISDIDLRETITSTTNKVEAYNGLSEWVSFAGNALVASNDPDEMEKSIKYNAVVTDSIILQNIVDMSDVIDQLAQENFEIRKEDVATLSPYITEHIKRFGHYIINLDGVPNKIGKSRTLTLK